MPTVVPQVQVHGTLQLASLGPIEVHTKLDIIAVDTKGNANIYTVEIRHVAQGVVYSHGGHLSTAIIVRVRLLEAVGLREYPIADTHRELAFVCIEHENTTNLNREFLCVLSEYFFDEVTRSWQELPNQTDKQMIISIKYNKRHGACTKPEERLTRHETVFPASLSGKYDEVRLTFGNIICVLSRQALLSSMREKSNMRIVGPAKKAYCLIPALNTYIPESDGRSLTTLKAATLAVDGNVRELAYIKTKVRSKPLESLHSAWQIKIMKPDFTSMSFARNDLRSLSSVRKSKECIHVPHLGHVSIKTISIIEQSTYKTFHVAGTGTPGSCYNLVEGWTKLVPDMEHKFNRIISADLLESTRDIIAKICRGVKRALPTASQLYFQLSSNEVAVQTLIHWQKINFGSVQELYEEYLWNAAPVRSWVLWLFLC